MTPARAVTVAEVARILQSVASRPNLRRRRRPGDPDGFDAWFDGGAVRSDGARTIFQLGDGTRVEIVEAPRLAVTIELPGPIVVTVEQR